jgi:uncharacterized membrane protein (Fun14 family)
MSTLNQIIAGGSLGLATGYVFSRVGKLAAFTLGTSVLVLQVAQHMGYIEIKLTKKSKIDQLKKKALKAAEEIGISGTIAKMESSNKAWSKSRSLCKRTLLSAHRLVVEF